jgi:nitronate monooxygenase
MLDQALAEGAEGIQVGTAFAFCEESGMEPHLKAAALRMSQEHKAAVFTDPFASPTGFPFKVLGMEGTLSDPELFADRTRICDLGYLREQYRKEDGALGFRCPGEPIEDYVKKGGLPENATCRKCVCNGLLATVGLGQIRDGMGETPLVTAGDDVANIARFLKPGRTTYTADDVLDELLTTA